ncbi:MAG: carboxypeptidase-like regulatory domain-containing protein [Flavobacteriaceae bacterium]|nr:carboxypeptidase-like regulatory domain-containing protein [Flavobacteriaceae bacterium]
MKPYSPYLLLLCFNIQFGICQVDLVGQVIDADTEEPLPYVNIGLVNKNIGTVTDEAGYFELEVHENGYAEATLRFSMIGFEPQDFTLQEYRDQKILTIPLKEKATALDEVVLTTKRNKYQTKILGNKTTSQLIYAAFTTNKLGNEMGFLVRGRKNPMILKKFNVSLVENDYGPIRFRLNFYDLKDGLPNETLLNENIIVETDIQSGIVSKDLTPYEIVIDQDFFVAIEWIEDLGPGKLFFSGGFFGSPLIAREVSQGTWAKVGSASVGMNVEVRY